MIFGFICSAVSSCVSAVSSFISSSVGAISSAFSSFTSSVGNVLASIFECDPEKGSLVGKVIEAVLQALGITKPDEKVEDLGDRAVQAAAKDITPEKFEDFDDYMKALREFELDPDASKKISTTEKTLAGLAVGTTAMEHKLNAEPGSLAGLSLLPLANPEYFTAERLQGLLNSNGGRLGGQDVLQYLENRLNGYESTQFEDSLKVQNGSPLTASENSELYKALDSAQAKWASLAATLEAGPKTP